MTNFSEFFKEAVKNSGKTREDLANQIGCPIGYISAQETGVVPPPVSFKLLRRTAEVLAVDLVTLCELAEEGQKDDRYYRMSRML